MSILNEVRRLQSEKLAFPLSEYVALVRDVHAGNEVDPEQVLAILDSLHKTCDDLENDVATYGEWIKLQAKTDPDMLARLQADSDEKFNAMQKACAAKDAAEAELKRLASEELTAGNVASRASSIATDARNAANQARHTMQEERFTIFREFANAGAADAAELVAAGE
jgi:hypothetical protein